jgi:nucleotide-binding universal stress UspA family protein
MKKFIVAFDGLRYSTSACDYAIQLAKQSSAHLVGVFLDDFFRHSYKIYDLVTDDGSPAAKQKKLEQKDLKTRQDATASFETACQKAGLSYAVHHDKSVAIQELLHESMYADLLILESGETLTSYKEKIPGEFIRDLLTQVQCPVLLVPHKFKPIKNLVLLFDGEPSSVYAIKMLSYTVASLKQEPTEVVSVKNKNQTLHLPDNTLMKEFMKRHFPKAHYTVLKGIPEIEIVNYLKLQKNCPLVVLGAYQRGMVSRWFRASMADVLMRDLKLPLFIAHTK